MDTRTVREYSVGTDQGRQATGRTPCILVKRANKLLSLGRFNNNTALLSDSFLILI